MDYDLFLVRSVLHLIQLTTAGWTYADSMQVLVEFYTLHLHLHLQQHRPGIWHITPIPTGA